MADEDIGGSVVRAGEEDIIFLVVDFQVSANASTSALATAFDTSSTATSAANSATTKFEVMS